MDPGGRTAIAYGVYGVPRRTSSTGAEIVSKFVGPLNAVALAAELKKAGAS
jgi:hypothetical protein